MNARNSLLILGAILLIVSQLFGEDSTIAALASSDDAELQAAMTRGETALTASTRADIPRRTARPERTADGGSLADFYGTGDAGDGEPDADVEPVEVPVIQTYSGGTSRAYRGPAAPEDAAALRRETIPDF